MDRRAFISGAAALVSEGAQASLRETRGAASALGFGSGFKKVIGSRTYCGCGTYSWVAPAGVNKVSVVAVSYGGPGQANSCCGGHGGGGSGLGYANNISVTPGNSYTVVIGCCSYFINTSTVNAGHGQSGAAGGLGGSHTGCGGGNGGNGGTVAGGGGGGAGGYSGNGGNGSTSAAAGGNGAACSGAAAGGATFHGGGGVGIMGKGSTGTGAGSSGGGGGSGGCTGGAGCLPIGGAGAKFGGGASGSGSGTSTQALGGKGAVRIVWPGCSRKFPSTCVGSP